MRDGLTRNKGSISNIPSGDFFLKPSMSMDDRTRFRTPPPTLPEKETITKILSIRSLLSRKWCTLTWRSRIRASWYNYENNQQDPLYRLIYYSKSAVHVSLDVFAHHQEHLTVFTVSGSVHPNCCKYSQVLLMMGENIARNMKNRLGIIN